MNPLEIVTSSAVALLVIKEITALVKILREKERGEQSQVVLGQSFKCGLEHGVLKEVVDRSYAGLEKIMGDQTEILKGLAEISNEQISISRRAVALAESAARHAEENNRILAKRRA